MSTARDSLIRLNFELERDYHYVFFRRHHWHMPEIAGRLPDEAMREKMLRDFWNQDAEERYYEYRKASAGMSVEELHTKREEWLEMLDCLGMQEYREMLDEASRRAPANDNDKTMER